MLPPDTNCKVVDMLNSGDPSADAVVHAAVVQMDVRIGENDANLRRVLEFLGEAAGNGAKLVVFPECALSGYCFSSLDDARPWADGGPSNRLKAFAEECRRL